MCEQRPDNPVEFLSYYILKHCKPSGTEGAPVGHFHPQDPMNPLNFHRMDGDPRMKDWLWNLLMEKQNLKIYLFIIIFKTPNSQIEI